MGSKEERPVKKYRLELLPIAQQDLVHIYDYISTLKNEPLNAIKVVDEISSSIEKIPINPLGYKECPELKTSDGLYRQSICYHWLIIFKIDEDVIRILTITS
jgi:plasmid stabilization system protein ParE